MFRFLRKGKFQQSVDNFLSMQLGLNFRNQSAAVAKTTGVTLTAAEILGGLLVATPGAAVNYQMPTAANIEAAFKAALGNNIEIGDAFDFTIVNVDATAANAATVTTNTGITLVGDMTIAGVTVGDQSSGTFRVRRASSTAYSVYRL